MSLFGGGDDSGPPSPSQASDFSISTIGEDQSRTAHSEGSPDTNAGHDDYNDHDDHEEQADGGAGGGIEEMEDGIASRSPSAMSDTSDVEVRPNRFRGSDRAWLHHTQPDRSLAHSLDQLAADDLSLHLYSAHHLKARLRQRVPSASTPFRPWSRKSRWLSTNQDVEKAWYPEPDWTAWPLPPDNAPVGNEVFGRPNDGLGACTLRTANRPTPADNLREQLHAVLLARAHLAWKEETHQPVAPRNVTPGLPVTPIRLSPAARGRTRSLSNGASSALSSPSVGDDLPPMSSLDQSIILQEAQGQVDSPRNGSIKDEDEEEEKEDEHLARPVFSADDDSSRALMDPTVNHIMSKLDKLLLALHQSRQAHLHRARDGDTSDSSARSNSRSRSTSNKPAKKPSKKASQPKTTATARTRHSRRNTGSASRQSSPQDLVVYDDSGEDETYEPEKPKRRSPSVSAEPEAHDTSPEAKKRRNAPRPGLRDWSEVLGIASLSGWDPSVVERARQRCSKLFGEDMHLYTMAEHGDSSADEAEHVGQVLTSRSNQSASWRCPLTNCFRNMQPLEHGFRWREHMRKSHKYDNDQIANLEEQLTRSGDIVPFRRHRVLAHNPRGWQPPDPLKCPHCPSSVSSFAKVSRLVDHIRRRHKYDPRIEDPPEQRASRQKDVTSDESSSSAEDSDDYMVGGVHNDGFLQPVFRHAGTRGRDLEQRAKRANARRSKAELKNLKKRKHLQGGD
ncbi:hypothetical protein D6D29_07246 [Aureobasidium pullulans]|nr:hypothetical protein D6D29_07246 [Aureobasidium pullulans]